MLPPEEVFSRRLYYMVRSKRGNFTSTRKMSGKSIDQLIERALAKYDDLFAEMPDSMEFKHITTVH